jgi:hypothetical protein
MSFQKDLSPAALAALAQVFEPEAPHECTIVSFNRNGQSRCIDRIYYHAPCTDGLCGASIVRNTNTYLTTHGIEPKQTSEAGVITEEDVRDKSILVREREHVLRERLARKHAFHALIRPIGVCRLRSHSRFPL